LIINDHSFNRCTQKNKACAESILHKGVYEKIDKKTQKITYSIKDKQNCNILCKNMVNMRDDDRNKYTPISHTRQKHFGSYMEGVLNIDHLKILEYILYNSTPILQLKLTGFESNHPRIIDKDGKTTHDEVYTEIIDKYGLKPIMWYEVYGAPLGETILIFQSIDDINYALKLLNGIQVPVLSAKKLKAELHDIPYLKTPLDKASYSSFASIKLRAEIITKPLSRVGFGLFCSKENEFNCRTFAEDFYNDSTKMLSTLSSILPQPIIHPGLLDYVADLLPFQSTPARNPTPEKVLPLESTPARNPTPEKRESKSLTPARKSKSKSLTPARKSRSKSLTPARKSRSKSLTPARKSKSKSLNRIS